MDLLPIRQDVAKAPTQKLVGLDALRAFAALGVVLLHACVPYLTNPMKGLAWPVQDQSSRMVDCVFWGIEVVIMPVFLVMAGFFAWRTLQTRGPKRLLSSRARRLLIPLIFGAVAVLPADLYVWVLGWVGEGLIEPVKLKSLKIEGELGENLWGLSHLWFLQYLFLYVAAFALAFVAITKWSKLARLIPSAKVSAFVLFAIGSITLCLHPEVVWGFQHSFAPVASKWIYSATFFAGGLVLGCCNPSLNLLSQVSRRLVLPAICLLVATVLLGRWQLATEHQLAERELSVSLAVAIMTTASAWMVTLALVGIAAQRTKPIPVAIKYLAAASFWIYLVHHPLLGLIHTDLKLLLPSVDPIAKMLMAFSLSSSVSIGLYEVFVRRTRLGQWLGFGWQFPQCRQEQCRQEQEAEFRAETGAQRAA